MNMEIKTHTRYWLQHRFCDYLNDSTRLDTGINK